MKLKLRLVLRMTADQHNAAKRQPWQHAPGFDHGRRTSCIRHRHDQRPVQQRENPNDTVSWSWISSSQTLNYDIEHLTCVRLYQATSQNLRRAYTKKPCQHIWHVNWCGTRLRQFLTCITTSIQSSPQGMPSSGVSQTTHAAPTLPTPHRQGLITTIFINILINNPPTPIHHRLQGMDICPLTLLI
jgi:hypothetical protein